MKRKLLSLLLCMSLICSITTNFAYAKSSRDTSFEASLAGDLKLLGLFKGVSETEFDLDRAPSRIESLVMLIRLLGSESAALSQHESHPFTDVPSWASDYVGYAYANHIANGVTKTEFGTGPASAAMYLTFVLRALGYSDAGNADFSWDSPYTLAESVGILPDTVDVSNFWRADAVSISYSALQSKLKNSSQTLASKLIKSGVFSEEKYKEVYNQNAFADHNQVTPALDAQKIYEKCSQSVFCIEIYDIRGDAIGLGSGFFISESGLAATNYHVIDGAMSAKVMLTNGEIYDVSGVVDFDTELDFAIIKVNGTGFTPLKLGNSSSIKGGESVFAIGNPEGLTNTISDGIISNPCRKDLNDMIQISVPISHGSSGGALINTAGEVIGITTSFLASGQNLNFAVPINFIKPDGGLSVLESSAVIPLSQFAAADGPQHGNPKQDAFNALKSWIQGNYNTTITTSYGVDLAYEQRSEERHTISYNESLNTIQTGMDLYYQGKEYILIVGISPEYETYTAFFSDPQTEASFQITPQTFSESSQVLFSSYTGPLETKEIYIDLCKYMALSVIDFADYVFKSFVPGNYSIKDLGFTSM